MTAWTTAAQGFTRNFRHSHIHTVQLNTNKTFLMRWTCATVKLLLLTILSSIGLKITLKQKHTSSIDTNVRVPWISKRSRQVLPNSFKWCPALGMCWILVSSSSNSKRVLLSSSNYSRALQTPHTNTGGSRGSMILFILCAIKNSLHLQVMQYNSTFCMTARSISKRGRWKQS